MVARMGPWIALGLTIGAIAAAVVWSLRRAAARRIARERLYDAFPDDDQPELGRETDRRRFARRHRWLPWLLAAVCFAVLFWIVRIPWPFAAAAAFLSGLLSDQLDAVWLAAREDRIENQLADAIDLMVAAVKVGASQQEALARCADEARAPLKPQLEEVVGRLRYGDDPREVLAELADRVPLETFQLFTLSLSVNWDVGGRLSGTLAAVGRTIRDRIELNRRLRAMTTQAKASVISVLLVSYFIAALMWRNDPDRMVRFLGSVVGRGASIAAMVLQGLGIVWISAMSRPRF